MFCKVGIKANITFATFLFILNSSFDMKIVLIIESEEGSNKTTELFIAVQLIVKT